MKTKIINTLTGGLFPENPLLRLLLGVCPALAVTTAALNGVYMGLTVTAVLILSNLVISLLRGIIPEKVRIPAFLVIIAGFVSLAQLLIGAFAPTVDSALGIYLPLAAVNCIILARAQSFASKNNVVLSLLDGLSMGIGFTAVLVLMGVIRELLGAGTVFALPVTAGHIDPMIIFLLPPGGFFVFGMLTAAANAVSKKTGLPPAAFSGGEDGLPAADAANIESAGEADE